MTALQWAVAIWLGGGLVAFAAWAVRVYVTSALTPRADWTSWVVYRCGQGFIWLAALLAAGAVFGLVARAAWSLFP